MLATPVLGVTWLQRQILFPRHLVTAPPGATPARDCEHLAIESPEGPVEGWLLPGRGITPDRPGPAVIFAHGNGELIDHWPSLLAPYRELGVTVVLPEYRGYGRSAGSPSEAAITEDLLALHRKLASHPAVDSNRLVYHGRSLGGGAVCALLRHHPPRALILESTFTSVTQMARSMGLPAFLVADRFESLDAVRRFDGPVLVIHGTRDEVVPTGHGRRLARACKDAELVLFECGHNDLPPPGADYWQRVEAFLRRCRVLLPA